MAEITPTSVSQQSTHGGSYKWCCSAEYAIDRDLTTWSAGAGWFKLDIDGIHYVHKIIIHHRIFTNAYNPDDHCVKTGQAQFRECLDQGTDIDVSVYQGEVKEKSCGALKLTYGLEQSDQIYTLLCNIDGDMVKLSKDTGHILIREIVVIGLGKTFSTPLLDFKHSNFLHI